MRVRAQPAKAPAVGLLALVAATFFMVSGGPYGLEELIAPAGYPLALLILVITPFVWSLPTALLVGELAAALPEEGGYYAWVRRALGPFWGFQEAWLSLIASVFDMAIYPTLFTLYLARLWPACSHGWPQFAVGALMIAACTAMNLRGARAVGGASVVMAIALLAPFLVMVVRAAIHPAQPAPPSPAATGLVGGLLVGMWNYMGWDNASTIAGEVDRPQRTYPLAMVLAVLAVAASYVLTVWAAWRAGLDARAWTTGAWVGAAQAIGGPVLATAVVVGGILCGVGMFNALILSYSRVPAALAEDGYLPSWVALRSRRTGTPWVAVALCSAAYAACLGLGFERLVQLDVVCYGLSLLLEFIALVVLRVREPGLARPFRVPGGTWGAALLGVPPMALLALALFHQPAASRGWSLWLGAGLAALGPIVYLLRRKSSVAAPRPVP